MGLRLQNETAMAAQLVRRHGNSAVLRANETATALDAMGDAEGAARWRRIRDLILDLPLEKRDGAGRA